MDTNPYATPQANLISDTEVRQAELVRREHINHEASIRSIGVLYYLMAAMFALTVAGMLASESTGGFEMGIGLFLALLVVVFIFVGRAIRRLDRRYPGDQVQDIDRRVGVCRAADGYARRDRRSANLSVMTRPGDAQATFIVAIVQPTAKIGIGA